MGNGYRVGPLPGVILELLYFKIAVLILDSGFLACIVGIVDAVQLPLQLPSVKFCDIEHDLIIPQQVSGLGGFLHP